MTIDEFSDQFDLQYNNITSNQAPGLSEFEKSVFATKAEKEIVKNYFSPNSKGNNLQQGFDDSAKRQADFSMLLKTSKCTEEIVTESGFYYDYGFTYNNVSPVETVLSSNSVYATYNGERLNLKTNPDPVGGAPYEINTSTVDVDNDYFEAVFGDNTLKFYGLLSQIHYTTQGTGHNTITLSKEKITCFNDSNKLDPRSGVYSFPKDTFIIINETLCTTANRILQVIPLRYDEYTRYMSKPYKRPLKYQAWRLMNSGVVEDDYISENTPNENAGIAHKIAEIITNSWDTVKDYSVRYIRTPDPIILADLKEDLLTIDGKDEKSKKINIDPILHEDILQRAVELAKVAWTATGQDNAQMVLQAGQRSE